MFTGELIATSIVTAVNIDSEAGSKDALVNDQ